MRILVIGSTGTIGTEVTKALKAEGHEVLEASRNGEVKVDIEDRDSIRAMYDNIGEIDVVISTAGRAAFGPLSEQQDDEFDLALKSKFIGQADVVRLGAEKVGQRFVLTSGALAESPWPGAASVAAANGAVQSFVRGAALDLEQAVNVVSPPLVRETAVAMGMDPQGPTAAAVAKSYLEALTAESGTIVKV